jgi:two-component system response regulator YesN
MIKLVIVDDEKHDIDLIINGISWDEIFIEVVGFAEDGEPAIKLIRETQPDIVITDIKMPVKTGIHLANLIREEYPDIKIIFISGYQDFNYAKAGIEYNVVDYIVKPVNIYALSNSLAETAKKCIVEKRRKFEMEIFKQQLEQSLPLLKERFFREWIFGTYDDENILIRKLDFLGIPLKSEKTLVMVLYLDDFKDIENTASEYEKQLLDARVLNCICDIVDKYENSYYFPSKQGEYVIIIQSRQDKTFNEDDITQISNAIKRNIASNCFQTCTTGIGGYFNNLTDLPNYYKRAVDAIQYRFYYGNNQIFFYNDFKFIDVSSFERENYKTELIRLLKIGDSKEISLILDEIFGIISKSSFFNIYYVKNLCIEILSACLNTINEYSDESATDLKDISEIVVKLEKFESIDGIWNWMKKFILEICYEIYSNMKDRNTIIVKQIKSIIDNRYNCVISVEEIANEINLSPGYASTVFKNETGETIIQYLTYARMQNAMKLLEETNLMVFEIAERVGYNNVTHFASVFKNNIGISPGEYRKK